jgi:hypothetical protein
MGERACGAHQVARNRASDESSLLNRARAAGLAFEHAGSGNGRERRHADPGHGTDMEIIDGCAVHYVVAGIGLN